MSIYTGKMSIYTAGTLTSLVMVTASIVFIIALIFKREDVDKLMLNALAIITMFAKMFRLWGWVAAQSNIKKLLDTLEQNWQIIINETELLSYAKMGKIVTIIYTKKGHFIDRETHSWLLFTLDAIATMAVAYVTVAADTMYLVVAQQCCALYSIVSHRLKQLCPLVGSDISSDSVGNQHSYKFLIQTMQFHQTAITFTEILSDGYSLSFLFIFNDNIILIPLGVCAMFAGAGSVLTVAFATFLLSLMFHLFIIFFVGQRIISHADDIFQDSYYNEWYSTSQNTKLDRMIFMLRYMRPSTLTAGELIVINYETYAVILQTSISYTVLLSFH